jgi:hypothetical protein
MLMRAEKKSPSKKLSAAKLNSNGREPVGPVGHWTQWIPAKGAALLSEMLGPVYFVVKNHGSNSVMLAANQGDLMDLSPGAVRATYARGAIRVENKGKNPALIEFDFMPIHLKP